MSRIERAGVVGTGPASDGAEPTRAASETAFELLYRERFAPMVRLAHLITGSNLAAADLAQEAFVKVRPRMAELDEPAAYLRQVVVNECRMWLRRRDVERRHREQAGAESRPVLAPELDETWEALARISPRRRIALVLRFYEDLSVAEVARAMGCREGTAKSLIHRGLASMQEVLADGDDD